MDKVRKTIVFFWALVPPLLLSVFVFGLPLIAFAVLSLMIWQQAGRNWALLAMLQFSGFTALF
jgi:hypothetical protein